MLDLFAVPLDELDLPHLTSFLADEEPEPLHWEAKGTDIKAGQITKAAGAFANSSDGGYLILGAAEDKNAPRAERWTVSGWSFPEEPKLWISKVVRNSLRPRPAIQVRTMECGGGRHVAVVWVPPAGVPPCLAGGTVYERVPGESITVKDPQRLAELYGLGKAALAAAERTAGECSEHLVEAALDRAHERREQESGWPVVALIGAIGAGADEARLLLGLCPVSVASDPGARLFTNGFATAMQQAIRAHTSRGGYSISAPSLAQTQTSMSTHAHAPGGISWGLEAWWDGSVGVTYEMRESSSAGGLRGPFHEAWALADEFARQLGGGDEHYLSVRITGITGLQSITHKNQIPRIERGPTRLPDKGSDKFNHVLRELHRIGGELAWEPDPAKADGIR